VGEIISGKTFFKRLAKTFEISLYDTLHKLIGLNFVTQIGFFTLGMSVICVIFNKGGKIQEFNELTTA
jgi:hypothetical protein